jgi:hypothetical protein
MKSCPSLSSMHAPLTQPLTLFLAFTESRSEKRSTPHSTRSTQYYASFASRERRPAVLCRAACAFHPSTLQHPLSNVISYIRHVLGVAVV